MKFKKVVASLLASAILITTLGGCGSTNAKEANKQTQDGGSTEEGTGESKELIELEFMLLNNQSGEGEKFVLKEIIKEKFNIDLKLVLNTREAHEEKLNLLIASNELPDLISPLSGEIGKDIGPKGALVAVDEYFDKMPNFKAKVMEDKNVYASIVAGDGHIYNMPRFSEQQQFKSVPLIRTDMVKAVGKEIPTNFKELIDVLEAIKAKYPDSMGLLNRGKMNFLWAYGIHYGTSQTTFYDKTQDKWVYGPLNEGFKEMLTDFNALWSKGLMDKEFFTSSTQQWEEKVLSGKGVFALDYATRSLTQTEAYKKLNPNDTTFKFEPIMPLVSDSAQTPTLNIAEQIGIWTSFGISADSPHIDRIVEMIDWMYSEEAATLIQWGNEGTHYTIEENMKKYVPTLKASYNPDGTIDPEVDLGLNHNRIMRLEKADGYEPYVEGYSEVIDRYKNEVEIFENNYRINLTFTDEETEETGFIETNIKTYVEEEALKFITGEKPLSQYNEFISYIEQNGGKRLEEIYEAAYGRYKEQLNSAQ